MDRNGTLSIEEWRPRWPPLWVQSTNLLKRFSATSKVLSGYRFATITPTKPPAACLVVRNPTRNKTHPEDHGLPPVLAEDCRGRLQAVKANKCTPLPGRFPNRQTHTESHRDAIALRRSRVPIPFDEKCYVRHAL